MEIDPFLRHLLIAAAVVVVLNLLKRILGGEDGDGWGGDGGDGGGGD